MSTVAAVETIAAPRRTAANAATVALYSSAAKIAGALKIAVMARYFAAGDALDTFLIAFVLPAFLADVIAGCLTPAVIPALSRVRSARGDDAACDAASAASTACGAFMLAVGVLLAAAAPLVVPLLGSGFSTAKVEQTVALFRILLLWLPISAYIAGWRALLNANGSFAIAAAAPIATPVLTIATLIASGPGVGPASLCFGTLAGAATELVVLSVALRRRGLRVRLAARGWTPDLAAAYCTYFPLAVASLVSSASAVVDQAVAGTLGSGSAAALAYGNRIVAVALAIVANSCATAVLPSLAHLVANRRWRELRRTMTVYIGGVFAISIPVTALLITESGAIVRAVFAHGGFDATAVEVVATTQQYALLQVPFALALALISRLCVALGMAGVLTRVAVLGLIANVAGDLALAPRLGVAGIAACTACVQATMLAATIGLLMRRQRRLPVLPREASDRPAAEVDPCAAAASQ